MAQTNEARLAILETKEDITQEVVDNIQSTLKSLDEKVGKIELKLEKSLSFIGGVAFTFSSLGALFAFVVTYLLSKLGITL